MPTGITNKFCTLLMSGGNTRQHGNVQGRLVQSTELTQKGEGQITVFAQDLSNGVYTYTLVVDGSVFETKKMVKQ